MGNITAIIFFFTTVFLNALVSNLFYVGIFFLYVLTVPTMNNSVAIKYLRFNQLKERERKTRNSLLSMELSSICQCDCEMEFISSKSWQSIILFDGGDGVEIIRPVYNNLKKKLSIFRNRV